MSKKKAYNNDSITALKGADRVRKRPAVIFGSDGLEGCQHSFFEILSNSIDEARHGYGTEITVIRHENYAITVKDNGRGIPVDYNNKEKRYNWELVFTELYAGGKYDNDGDSFYEYSLGLNGLGLCATQYSSAWMEARILTDDHEYKLRFEKGNLVKDGFVKTPYKYRKTGSEIKWLPDLDVFKEINIPSEYFQSTIKKQAVVNAGVKFIFKDEITKESFEYLYKNGIVDYLEEINDNKNISDIYYFEDQGAGKDRADMNAYKVKAQFAFSFNNEVNRIEYYHNSSYLEYGGSPDKAVKNAFVYEMDKYIKKLGLYTKNEKKITFIDIQDSLVLVTNSFSTVTSYENQTKKAITNRFIQEFMTDFIKRNLEVFFIENKEISEKVIKQILINKRSREKAEKTRLNLKRTLSSKVDVTNRIKKFVDCRIKEPEVRELYILEGDSALGACKLSRDSEFQALMPVRGKILNCLKADYEKIFKSEIIVDLIKIIGCGIEIKSKHNKDLDTFNYENLKYNKIIICTDADVDGFQIRALILAMFYRLTPTLIEEGRIYIAESPLYEIEIFKKGGSEIHFAYNEMEKKKILEGVKEKYSLQRSKGLGENDPQMMSLTTMNPATRRLIQVTPENVEKTQEMFDILLGDNIEGRKQLIEEKGSFYLEQLDLS